jgi:hypothetical protein
MTYVKGDIIWVEADNRDRKRLKHPAVVWQDEFDGNSDFIGLMITHTELKPGFNNILMDENHFEKGFEVGFDNSHFVNQLFQKFEGWGSFHKAGSLTNEGIQFMEDNLTNTEISEFEIYIRR